MSLFQSVWVKLRCQRCTKVHETSVQFHSDITYDAAYELMEVVPRSDGLFIGEVYEGNGDRYCQECFRLWVVAQASAGYESLAELIERGLVTARAKGVSSPLTGPVVIQYREKYTSEFANGEAYPVGGPFFEEFDLVIGDKPVEVGGENWIEFLDLIDPLISGRMRKGAWIDDSCALEDFRVLLDDKRRIIVEDMEGKRLMPDGARAA